MDKMDAFCERLIKGMETTNRKIEEKTSCWYAVYTAVKAEKSVKEQLDKAGIESYLPLQSIVRSWNNRKRKVMVPVIPGCVFVRLPMCRDSCLSGLCIAAESLVSRLCPG